MATRHRLLTTPVANVYPSYIAKAEKKGRTKAEVDAVISWLTGYSPKQLEGELKKKTDFETFFAKAPKPNPGRSSIKGVICGVRIEEIQEPTMREIRYLDKLVDELAQGKPMAKVLREESAKAKANQPKVPLAAGRQTAQERKAAEAELGQLIAKFASTQKGLVGSLRKFFQGRLPGAHEIVYEYRDAFVLSFSSDDRGYEAVFAIRGSADGVKLYFNRGGKLPDPGKLLKGSGKTRSIALKGASDLKLPALASLIDAAIAGSSVPFSGTVRGPLVIRSTTAKRRRAG